MKFRSSSPVDPERIFLPESGTYPITIEIRSAEGAVATTRSHLIRLPSETAEIPLLPVAVIVPVASSLTDGLSLEEVQAILETSPGVLFTIQLDDVVLNQLESDPETAAEFAAALGGRPVISEPSFNLDPSALAEIDQTHLFALAVERTANRLDALGLRPAEGTLALDAALTQEGAELLLDLGFSQILLVGSAGDQSPGTIATPGGSLRMVEPDEELTELLTSSNRSVERAYDLLAVLATRYQISPAPVILGGDRFGSLDRQALEILFDALNQPALFDSSGLRAAAVALPSLPIRPAEQSQQDLQPVATELAAVDKLSATSAEFTGGIDVGGAEVGGGEPNQTELALLASLSRDRNPEDRMRAVTRVLDDLQDTFEVITLPEAHAVTLTAVENPLPFTIENSAAGPRTVLLQFRSDRVAVLASSDPDAAVADQMLLVIPPGSSTIDLTVRAQSLGVSTLEVLAFTPDGQQTLGTSQFRLRSTAVPNLGWLICGLALVFLIVWWARQWKSGPRSERNIGDQPRQGDPSGLDRERAENPLVEASAGDQNRDRSPIRAAEGGIQ